LENLAKNKDYWSSKIEYYDEELKALAKRSN
jgi:hypothetical protein